jgi:hypothetical protein
MELIEDRDDDGNFCPDQVRWRRHFEYLLECYM